MRSPTPWLVPLMGMIAIIGAVNVLAPRANGQANEVTPAILKAKPLTEEASDDRLRKLLKARYNARLTITMAHYVDFRAGKASSEPLLNSSRRLLQAGMELRDQPAEKVDLLKQMLELCDSAEKSMSTLIIKHPLDAPRLTEFRLELEITMEKLKKLDKAPQPRK